MSLKSILTTSLYARKDELEKTISKATKILKHSVHGNLEVSKKDNHYRYYVKASNESLEEKPKRTYIKDIDTAKALANRDYSKQVLKSANQELKQINSLLSIYDSTSIEDCFSNLHPGRKLLVSPIVIDDEQYASHWLSTRTKIQNAYPKRTSILTENEEIVRSKSEKIIADKLKLSGIPYKYEEPLILDGTLKFPDFTVLNKRTRKEYYWEHMGMLDNPEYFRSAIAKLEIYFRNNIIPGKNLIVTYETSKEPLSVKSIEILIKEYLL